MIGSIISDALVLAGIDTPASVSAALDGVLNRVLAQRIDGARKILLSEVSRGAVTLPDAASQDDFVAMLFRYDRAAREGAARGNLRLLARAIAAHSHGRPVYADDFLRYARIVESLTYEEILLLAAIDRQAKFSIDAHSVEISEGVRKEMTPVPLSLDTLRACVSSLESTGMIVKLTVWDDDGTTFKPTQRFFEVAKMAMDFNVEEI